MTITTTVDATNLVNLRRQFKAVSADRRNTADRLHGNRRQADGARARKAPDAQFPLEGRSDPDLAQRPYRHRRRHRSRLDGSRDSRRSRALAARARRSLAALSPSAPAPANSRRAELSGSTFTVSNLGQLGVEVFTPLINPPECAILGLGRIQSQVVVENKQFVERDRMFLSLTFDHRIVDGAPAARFLQTLGRLIENPSPWLLP